MNTKIIKEFQAARRVSTPLLGITTTDQQATIDALCTSALKDETPILKWDVVNGIRPVNKAGQAAMAKALNPKGTDDGTPPTAFPTDALIAALKMPKGTCLFMMNIHLFMRDPTVLQGIWNLREEFKINRRTLVLLAPALTLPPELEPDVIMFDEPLPTPDELHVMVKDIADTAGVSDKITPAVLERAVSALAGLPSFTSEQVTAMSLTSEGIDTDLLWERKRQAIEHTPGLQVWRGGETFSDIGGCANAKNFLGRVLAGEEPPQTVVWLDEIEKMISGAGGAEGGGADSSGVSQDQLGQLLSYMQDHRSTGLLFIGPPGSAKSLIAKATGNTAGIPTIQFDLGGMKGSLVGESEARIRNALKVVTAVSQDKALFIATCNSLAALPVELRRRFKFGTFFFDLPTAEERDHIWAIHTKKFNVGNVKAERPDDTQWTGAEIQQCCELAYRLKTSLKDAATFVVPVARSAAEKIQRLREQASGRFTSASKPGLYEHESHDAPATPAPKGKRDIRFN